MKPKLDLDTSLERQRQIEHKKRHGQLNATCPHCHTDVLEKLEKSARDWGGYGPPESTVFECPHCEEEIKFELAWHTVLSSAKPVWDIVPRWAMPVVQEPAHEP